MKNLVIITLFSVASLVQLSYAQQVESTNPQNNLEKIKAMTDLDCDNSSQCKSIGIGHSPCGGYARYLVYSAKTTEIKKLKSLANQYSLEQQQKNKKTGMVGICVHISPPKTYCSANQCIASTSAFQ